MSAPTAAITTDDSPSSPSPPPSPTTPRADAVTGPQPVSLRAGGDGVRVAVDAMGGDHGVSEVVPGALDHARSHPDDRLILVGDESAIRGAAGGTLPANASIV